MKPRPSGLAAAGTMVALAAALAAPWPARAGQRLLDGPLRLEARPSLSLFPAPVLHAQAPAPPAEPVAPDAPSTEAPPSGEPPETGSPLDFDLLGEAEPPRAPADDGRMRRRRTMLKVHQGLGLGLVGLQLATTVVGQLNYSDLYSGGPETARYKLTHKALAYTTLGVFVATGALALLAPSAPEARRRVDRVAVHRIAMLTAAAGMVAQAVLGIHARERVGRLDQERFATVHLAVGYATFAAVAAGVGALVF